MLACIYDIDKTSIDILQVALLCIVLSFLGYIVYVGGFGAQVNKYVSRSTIIAANTRYNHDYQSCRCMPQGNCVRLVKS